MLLEPEEFSRCFLSWVKTVNQVTNGEIIAIDGKQLRRSHDKKLGKKAIHMVSAWATQNELVLGQVKVDSKSNEITAIPQLLEMLEISGCIVTIDAMGCQKKISQKIIEKKGDYVLSLKMNHKTLFLQVKELFAKLIKNQLAAIAFDYHQTEEISHGRLEIRQCWTIQLVDLAEPLYKSDEWKKLKTIVMIKSQRFLDGQCLTYTRYFISSLTSSAQKHLQTVRRHWRIENSLHWVLDIAFREDESRLRTGYGPQNFAILRHLAINLLKHERSSEGGIQSKRLEAGWNEDYLTKIIGP
jgi:predicted transposase YbfD/YdcC